jgi:hypothetical protein
MLKPIRAAAFAGAPAAMAGGFDRKLDGSRISA